MIRTITNACAEAFPVIGGSAAATSASIANKAAQSAITAESVLIYIGFAVLGALAGYAVKALLDELVRNVKLRKQLMNMDKKKK